MFSDLIKTHLSAIRPYIIFSVIFFSISVFIGFVFAEKNPIATVKIIEEFAKIAKEAGEPGTADLFAYLLSRNIFASFMAMALGAGVGLFSLLSLFINGAMAGIVGFLFSADIYLLLIFFAGILPHGIFELPAFFFASATGLWLGNAVFRWLFYDEKWVKEKFIQGIKFFFLVVAPLLVLAALIESFITPKILALLFYK